MTLPRVIKLGEVEIDIWDEHRLLATVFPDGLSVTAAANDDPDSVARAHDLGYAGDCWEMSKAHELAHHILSCAQGRPYSRVLRGVAVREAGGKKDAIISQQESDFEEQMVLEFQRYVMTAVKSRELRLWAADEDLDLDALAAQLRSMTGE